MLKKMRWRFIGAAMAAFFAVVLTLLCLINIWNYHSVTTQQDSTLQRLLEVEHRSQERPFLSGKPPFDSVGSFSPEVPYMIRFFSVHYDRQGTVYYINQNYIASISAVEAQSYANHVLTKHATQGYYKGYRYLIDRTEDTTSVLFLNSEKELQSTTSLLWITVVIAAVSLCIVFLLVFLLSGRAITPYLRNIETQKQFITNAGHELKTPLTAISTSADVLSMEEPENEWVQNIQLQSARLSKLITNLVTLSRLDEENPLPSRVEFSLSDILWELSEPFVSLSRAKGKTYIYTIEDALTLNGDPATVQQMVSVLLDNALKYSSAGGTITLNARRDGKRIELTVENTCDTPEQIDTARLFDRFYRGDESHSNRVNGTGIGLSIAKATAEAHGGTITAETTAHTLRFRVRL